IVTLCYKSHSRTSYHLRACAPVFRSSSMAEHSAVNRRVVGSSPTCGAIFLKKIARRPVASWSPLVFSLWNARVRQRPRTRERWSFGSPKSPPVVLRKELGTALREYRERRVNLLDRWARACEGMSPRKLEAARDPN